MTKKEINCRLKLAYADKQSLEGIYKELEGTNKKWLKDGLLNQMIKTNHNILTLLEMQKETNSSNPADNI